MTASIVLGGIVAICVLGYIGYRLISWKRNSEEPLISLVYLLKEPRPITQDQIVTCASKAFNVTFDVDNEKATEFVIDFPTPPVNEAKYGKAASFMVKVQQGMFLVHSFPAPYVDNPRQFAKKIPDGRLQRVIENHKAWLSVDAFGDVGDADAKTKAYLGIGKMIAELAGPDCLAVYSPDLGRCNEYDARLLETLRSSEPLSLFKETTFVPVVNVDGEDPRMVEAVAEARRRWPEFVTAFENDADKDKPFIVKAEFKDGDATEFMWMSVMRIDDKTITGILGNTPNRLTNVKEGQEVTVPLSALNDWLYSTGQDPVGGFTIKVIAEIQGKKQK